MDKNCKPCELVGSFRGISGLGDDRKCLREAPGICLDLWFGLREAGTALLDFTILTILCNFGSTFLQYVCVCLACQSDVFIV